MRALLLIFVCSTCIGCVGSEHFCSVERLNAIVSERSNISEVGNDVVIVHLAYLRKGYLAGEMTTDVQKDRIVLKVKPLNEKEGKSREVYYVSNPDDLPIYLSDGKNLQQIYPAQEAIDSTSSAARSVGQQHADFNL